MREGVNGREGEVKGTLRETVGDSDRERERDIPASGLGTATRVDPLQCSCGLATKLAFWFHTLPPPLRPLLPMAVAALFRPGLRPRSGCPASPNWG